MSLDFRSQLKHALLVWVIFFTFILANTFIKYCILRYKWTALVELHVFLIHYKDLVHKSQLLWKFPGFQFRFSTFCFLRVHWWEKPIFWVVPLRWKYKKCQLSASTFFDWHRNSENVITVPLPCPSQRHKPVWFSQVEYFSKQTHKQGDGFGLREQHIISTSTPNWHFFNKVSPHVRK